MKRVLNKNIHNTFITHTISKYEAEICNEVTEKQLMNVIVN